MPDMVHVGIFGKPDLLSSDDIPIVKNDMRMQVRFICMNNKKAVKTVGGKPFGDQIGYHIPEHLNIFSGGFFFGGKYYMRGMPCIHSGVFDISFMPVVLELIEVVSGKPGSLGGENVLCASSFFFIRNIPDQILYVAGMMDKF